MYCMFPLAGAVDVMAAENLVKQTPPKPQSDSKAMPACDWSNSYRNKQMESVFESYKTMLYHFKNV